MKNTVFRLMLAISMILLLTGCGGSSVKGSVKELNKGAEQTRYLMKTRKQYRVSDSGEKELNTEITYEYDDNGNCFHEHYENIWAEGAVDEYDVYHIYELDEEGRVAVRHDLNQFGEKKSDIEFSYVNDQYTYVIYSYEYGMVVTTSKGFVRDGEICDTEVKFFDAEHPATENGGGYDQKYTYTYDGTRVIEQKLFDQNDEMVYQVLFEYELDENGNPFVKKETVKDPRTGDVSYLLEEYTYIGVQ